MAQPNPCKLIVLVCLAVVISAASAMPAEVPTPEGYFGFTPGSDGELLDYEQLISYLQVLDAASDRLELRQVGASPEGRPMYVAFLSAVENIAALDSLRDINRRLALEPELAQEERQELIGTGRLFLMLTLSMHSTEVGPSQSLPLFAHELVTTDSEELLGALAEVVLMVVPCHNPDGMDKVVEHFRKYRGTRYEGSSMPGLYHRYVGHDNNRDFVTLTQDDTRVISRLVGREWYPQVLVEKHQMGGSGPRYFVPPNHDPIAENIDEAILHWAGVFGAGLARDMTRDGCDGVAQHWLFDDYWPGSTETSEWKNVISLLTEAAGCQVAKPVFVEPTELRVSGKGLAEYKKSVNMLKPWPGGWWRLGDIVRYELSSLHSILATAAASRAEILELRNDLCRKQVKQGRSQPPYYFVLPAAQHDSGALWELVALLQEHGITVQRLTSDVQLEGRVHHAGDLVVPLAQPYRSFVKEVMEAQVYPIRHYAPGGEVIRPYDITSWSLPLHSGVSCLQVDTASAELEQALTPISSSDLEAELRVSLPEQLTALAFPATANDSFRSAFLALEMGLPVSRLSAPSAVGETGTLLPAGSFLVPAAGVDRTRLQELLAGVGFPPLIIDTELPAAEPIHLPRIALVESWFHDMDAGWTRYVLDTYHVPYTLLRPGDLRDSDLVKLFDVIVLPNQNSGVLKDGAYKDDDDDDYYRPTFPPEYSRGMGDEGMQRLTAFLDAGGLIVSWEGSTDLFLGELTIKRDGEPEKDKKDRRKDRDAGGEPEDETFRLPVKDASDQAGKAGLYVPGSLLQVELLPDHPLTWGMPARTGVFSRGRPVLRTSIPNLDMDRRVIAAYPEEDILLSGFIEGEEQLARTAAMVWLRKGRGQLVLFAFAPQFRASTPATYKLLFNALLLKPLASGGDAREP